jgi:hypothetical protein
MKVLVSISLFVSVVAVLVSLFLCWKENQGGGQEALINPNFSVPNWCGTMKIVAAFLSTTSLIVPFTSREISFFPCHQYDWKPQLIMP